MIKAEGGKGLAFACDTSDPESISFAHVQVTQSLGDTDILVSAAGVGKYVPLAEVSMVEWNRVISIPRIINTPMTANNYRDEATNKARSAVNGAELLIDGGLTQIYSRLLPRTGHLA